MHQIGILRCGMKFINPIDRFLGLFSHDIGIDLGTANTLVYVRGKGIVIREPSAVARHKKSKEILAIGASAKKMTGRAPATIEVIRPLRNGVIADFDATAAMLAYYIKKVHESGSSMPKIPRPRVVIGIPSGVTEVERRAVQEAAIMAGAREAYLIEEPMAAAIGAGLPIQESSGSFICDIGGGTTEVAVISMGGVIASRSLRIAGDKLNEDILRYMREEKKLLIGEATAEQLKCSLGSAFALDEELEGRVRGRDLISGLPKEMTVSSEELREAMERSVGAIVLAVKNTIEETPPELTADILNRHIFLAGGGALLKGLDEHIARETKLFVKIVDDPLTAVVRGCGFVLENVEQLKSVLVSTQKEDFI